MQGIQCFRRETIDRRVVHIDTPSWLWMCFASCIMDAFQRESTAFLSPWNIRDKMRSFQAIPYLSIHEWKKYVLYVLRWNPGSDFSRGSSRVWEEQWLRVENVRICFSLASYSLWPSLLSIKTEWTECIGESSAYSKEIEVNRFIRTRNFLRKSTDQKIASRPLIC